MDELRETAKKMYEHYSTLVEAGFTQDQAIQLICTLTGGGYKRAYAKGE